MVFRRQTKGFGGYMPQGNRYAPTQPVPPPAPPLQPNAHLGYDPIGMPINFSGNVGTYSTGIGGSNLDSPLQSPAMATVYDAPINTTTIPGLGVTDAGLSRPVDISQVPGSQTGMTNGLQGYGVAPPGYGIDQGTGLPINSVVGQGTSQDMLNYALTDPAVYGMFYNDLSGGNMNGGNYALSQQYADNMPMEWLMTTAANTPGAGAPERSQFYEQNIQEGMTPGSAMYTTTDFLGQAFAGDPNTGQGSAMYDYIWNQPNEVGKPPSHQEQLSRLLTAMESVVGASVGSEMLDVMAGRYMQSYQEYQLYLMHNPGQANDLSLQEWFTSQGLGMPGGGQ